MIDTSSGVRVSYLGLGSSLGDRESYLVNALRQLHRSDGIAVCATSKVYESPHLGLKPGDETKYPAHLNLVAQIETTLSPEALLIATRKIEDLSGRERSERWGPRTLDIDLLTFEGIRCKTETLTLPHPGLTERLFVLLPLLDLEPNFRLEDGTLLSARLEARLESERKLKIFKTHLDWED